MIEPDPTNPVPLYLQIADELRRLIAVGALRPGDQVAAQNLARAEAVASE